ncbi:MAG: hypothetical protein LBL07_06155 [Tannerella sp.]|jgi:hypothetical protein|nr:hypothetical protein [Tannerella sp.]
MKPQWNKLCENLANYGELISKTLEFLPPTKQCGRIKKALAKEWEQITKTVGELDLLVDPINPIEIKYPFESERFKAMWKYYKDFLLESHNMTLCSRVENSRLTQLYRFSGKDEERAMLILELLCANNYRTIICPANKQLTGEEEVLPEQQPANLSINRNSQEI